MLRRGARHRGDQAGVVDQLPVVGEQAAVETVAAHGRAPIPTARSASTRRDRGSVDAGVPASRRSPSPATKPDAHQRARGRGPSTAAAAPAAASPGPGEGRCASSGFRVRRRCAGRCRRCRSPDSAARRAPASNSTGWCRTPGRASPPAPPTGRATPRPARYRCPVMPPPITSTSSRLAVGQCGQVGAAARGVEWRSETGHGSGIRSAQWASSAASARRRGSARRSAPTGSSTG